MRNRHSHENGFQLQVHFHKPYFRTKAFALFFSWFSGYHVTPVRHSMEEISAVFQCIRSHRESSFIV